MPTPKTPAEIEAEARTASQPPQPPQPPAKSPAAIEEQMRAAPPLEGQQASKT